MANDNPSPIAPEIRVVLAGNLADDDLMWIVRCAPRELQRLLLAPPAWVAALAALPDWGTAGVDGPVPAPVLLPDFALVVHPKAGDDPDGWVTVQGIGDTNEITVLATRDAAIGALLAFSKVATAVQAALDAGTDPFAPFWAEAAEGDRTLLANVVAPIAWAYGHYEILTPGEAPGEAAARTLAMLLSAALDPAGLAAMLGSLPQRALYVDGSSREPGRPVRFRADDAPSVVCTNVAAPVGDDASMAIPANCLKAEGPHDPADDIVIVNGVIVKRYGVE